MGRLVAQETTMYAGVEREDEAGKSEAVAFDERLVRLFSSDPETMADSIDLWKKLREDAPAHPFSNGYLFSRAQTIKKLINDPRARHGAMGSGKRAEAIRAALPPHGQIAFDGVTAFEAMYMSRNNGEPHDRLRGIAQRTFTPKRIGQIGEVIEQRTDEYLTALAKEPMPDFMKFAYRLPLKIIGDLLGIPDEDLDMVHDWSSKLARNRGGTELQPLLEAHEALQHFREYVERQITALRSRPPVEDDINLVGDLLTGNEGESLSDAELTAMFVVLLFAGHETTTNLIATGLFELLRSGQWAVLKEQPELLPQAINELVRFVSPVQWLMRAIAEPMEVEGKQLEPGDVALLMIAAASRDPEIFENPDVLDVARPNSQFHLGFGRGGHVCLGSHLAKMEAQSAFTALLRRFPDIQLATEEVRWTGHASLRSLAELPVQLIPRG
jgi:cytochrome P450